MGESRKDVAADLRLVEMAIARQWPIDPEKRPKIVAMLTRLVLDDDAPDRQRAIAARVLVSMDKVSLDALMVAMKAEDHTELKARLEALEEAAAAVEEGPAIGPRLIIPDVDTRYDPKD